jgi:ABC-type phosphate/phosphonate transport system permease subunit
VAGLLAGLTAAILTAGTGVGLVAGVITILVSLTGAITSLLFGVGLQTRAFEQANEASDTMPGNAWPQATS